MSDDVNPYPYEELTEEELDRSADDHWHTMAEFAFYDALYDLTHDRTYDPLNLHDVLRLMDEMRAVLLRESERKFAEPTAAEAE